MSDVIIYGSSDDLIEVEGSVPGCDEYAAESATFVLHGGLGDAARITVMYGGSGMWSIAIAPLDEDVPLLSVSMGMREGHSPRCLVSGVVSVVREATT